MISSMSFNAGRLLSPQ